MSEIKMKEYLYSYNHGRGLWGFKIHAESMEDAQARVESIKQTLKFDGESCLSFPFWMPVWLAFRWLDLKEWLAR